MQRDVHEAGGVWEHWTHIHELDWVPTETIFQARIGLIDLYWALYDAYKMTSSKEAEQKRHWLRKLRKAYRHITSFTSALEQRGTTVDAFLPHQFDRQGNSWGVAYKEPGLPPIVK